MELNSAFLINEPIDFTPHIQIYSPPLKEVIGKNSKVYNTFVSLITLSQEDIWDLILESQHKEITGQAVPNAETPLEYLMHECYQSETILNMIEQGFKIFTHQEVKVLTNTKTILFTENIHDGMDISEIVFINDSNYFNFQNMIRYAIGEEPKEPPNPKEHPKVALMKAKARLRDRVKKKKGVQGSISLSTMLISICCMGIGLTPLNIGEIPYVVLSDLFRVSQDKEKFETDLKIATAGFGNSKIKPQHWIKNDKK